MPELEKFNSSYTGAQIDAALAKVIAGPAVYTGTLLAASWSGNSAPYTYELTVNGLLATDSPIIDITMSGTYATDEARNSAWAKVYRAVPSADTLTVYASEKPTVDLPIKIMCVR